MEVHEISWTERRCEIGFWILGEYEGQGYISEALETVENALFKIGLNRLEIRCSSSNERSARVPRRNGYSLECGATMESPESDTFIFVKNGPKNTI